MQWICYTLWFQSHITHNFWFGKIKHINFDFEHLYLPFNRIDYNLTFFFWVEFDCSAFTTQFNLISLQGAWRDGVGGRVELMKKYNRNKIKVDLDRSYSLGSIMSKFIRFMSSSNENTKWPSILVSDNATLQTSKGNLSETALSHLSLAMTKQISTELGRSTLIKRSSRS